MSLERIYEALESLNLSQTDTRVYIYLATNGPAKARSIINNLPINKRQVYRSLKNLQNKGITMSNNEFSSEFSAVPFEKLLDLLLESKKEEIKSLQNNKEKIILDFRGEKKKGEEGGGRFCHPGLLEAIKD